MKLIHYFLLFISIFLFEQCGKDKNNYHFDIDDPAPPLVTTAYYSWDNLPVGGGGYVTGIAIHPLNKDIIYIRTNVGEAYSWDVNNKR